MTTPARQIQPASVALSYTEAGRGPAVVLLHGFPVDRTVWSDVLDGLAPSCRVIAPDLYGFGNSRGDQAFTIASQADAVHNLLTSLAALPCMLAGLSMGGYIALALAKRHPTALHGLILVDSKPDADTPEAKAGRDKMLRVLADRGPAGVVDEMFPKMLTPTGADGAPGRHLRQMMFACPAQTMEHALAAMRDRADYTDTLTQLTVPVLFVTGEDDVITAPEKSARSAALCRQGKAVVVPSAGHMSPVENPSAVADAIARFVAESDE